MKDSVGRGAIAELVLATALSKKGYNVYIPLTHKSKYDLVVDVHNVLKRIQVKRVFWCNNHGHKIPVMETRRLLTTRSANGKCKAGRYTEFDYDYLVGVDVDNDCFYTFTQAQASRFKAQIYLKSKVENKGILIE